VGEELTCCERPLKFAPAPGPSWADYSPEVAVCSKCRTRYERPRGVTDHAYRQTLGKKVCTKCGSVVRSVVVTHKIQIMPAMPVLPYPKKNEQAHYCPWCDKMPQTVGTPLRGGF
jgi:hypothetical protein